MNAARTCAVCGYARDVQPVALMVNGRIVLDSRLCGYCRTRLLDAVEHATDYRTEVEHARP